MSIDELVLLVDEGHRDFLYVAESFQKAISTHQASYTKVAQMFLETCAVLRTHYADEEALMEHGHYGIRYPTEHQAHITHHRNVLNALDEFSNRFLIATHDTYLSLANEICEYLVTLQHHIDSDDHILISACLAEY